ncbi:MAG: P-type conjugative transfer protein TrbG [Rhodospirillales bacterium]|nr:P-type conjugative transfer protein TrbG [Rhodospirillales bacterium]
MMFRNRSVLAGVSMLALAGCAGTDREFKSASNSQLVAAQPVTDTPTTDEAPQLMVEPQLRELPNQGTERELSGAEAIRTANKKARMTSTAEGFVEAVQYYDYMGGTLYQVVTAPGHITSIVLRPGERLIDMAAGDTVRWVIGQTTTGRGALAQTLVLIKPIRPKLTTNLMVATDERVYMLELESVKGDVYNAAIAWNYAEDQKAALQRSMQLAASVEPAAGMETATLNTGYTVETVEGDEPDWLPTRVFDDGRKTYIEFPDNLGVLEAPPLFVLNESGDAQVVNYRVRDNVYIVDRLVRVAELRLGEEDQTIVRITRAGVETPQRSRVALTGNRRSDNR